MMTKTTTMTKMKTMMMTTTNTKMGEEDKGGKRPTYREGKNRNMDL